MLFIRRWLRIQQGELSYFKIGEENQVISKCINFLNVQEGPAMGVPGPLNFKISLVGNFVTVEN